jgi:endo-beta-N-acetylglucosaminidase D
MEKNVYTAWAGATVTMKCSVTNVSPIDVVWIYYVQGTDTTKTIYFENNYLNGLSSKFLITLEISNSTNITTYLTIPSVEYNDSLYTYQCECNIYRKSICANNRPSAVATLTALTTTTSMAYIL